MDDDDYGYGRSLGLLRLLDYGQVLLVPLAIGMVLAPFVLYIIARQRAKSEPFPDGQLGLKFALSYFKTLAFHLLLWGLVIVVYAVLKKGNEKGTEYRTGFGILVPAAVVYGIHLVAMTRTNQGEQPIVGRMFAGWSLVMSGLVGFVGLLLVSQTLFQKGSSGNAGRFMWSLFLVYGSAWVVQAARFRRSLFAAPEAELPYYPPPPGAYAGGEAAIVPSYAAAASPFAPPPPPGDAAYAPPGAPVPAAAPPDAGPAAPLPPAPVPPGSPFAPATASGPTPTPVPGASPFAPPAAPAAPAAPSPYEPSPFAPPGLRGAATPATPAREGVPAPMAQPLAPPGTGPGSRGGSGG